MKKAIFILIGIMVINLNVILAQEYNTKVEIIFESPENTNMQHVKSTVDSKGNLHIVFTDGNTNTPYYGTNKTGKWEYEKLTYFSEDYQEEVNVAYFPNITINNNDNISIAMFGRYKEELLFAQKRKSETQWKFSSANKTSDLQKFYVYAEYTDMCVDKNGGLHLICNADYWDKSEKKHDQSAIYFYKPISGNWKVQMVIPGIVDKYIYGKHSSIASYGNKVYASIGGSKKLHFASKNISGGQWDIEQLFDTHNSMNAWKFETSLCISNNGNPSFAFYEYYGESDYKYHGLNLLSKNKCKSSEWIVDQSIPDNEYKRFPAIGIDNNEKTYIAFGGNELNLFTKSCDCVQKWEQLFKDSNIKSDYIDMVIDKQNSVHVFYTYERKVYHLKTSPTSNAEKCNYRPSIAFSGKTNVGPGEEWTGTFTTNDYECDLVEIYSIILPNNFKLTDHGNGTATIKGTIEGGKGFGEIPLVVLCNDNQHSDANGNHSKVTIKLKLTQKGEEKGSVKYYNNCTGSSNEKNIIGGNAKSTYKLSK